MDVNKKIDWKFYLRKLGAKYILKLLIHQDKKADEFLKKRFEQWPQNRLISCPMPSSTDLKEDVSTTLSKMFPPLLEATKFDDANVMPSPSADSKFVLSLLKLFKHAQFIVYTQNHFGILKS